MTAFRGLTWDHPRGRNALRAASEHFSASGPDTLTWDVHPLEGFESTPLETLAGDYDLIVLDHPHLGDALAHDSLRPLDELFRTDELDTWSATTIGPSFASYTLAGRPWALPLDAATQVSARRADLLPDAPQSWAETLELATRSGGVAPSLAGPHAFLSLCSIAAGMSADTEDAEPDGLFPRPAVREAFGILRELAAHAPAGTLGLNPIGLLERMAGAEELVYVPLVYGYVNYATGSRPISFGAPPHGGARVGSTLGGTGIALTRLSEPTQALLDHLRWLMSTPAQTRFIPQHDGQPASRPAWTSEAVNTASDGFYRSTLATIEGAWVRPRFAGYVAFQSNASALLRDSIARSIDADTTIDRLFTAFAATRRAAERIRT